RAIGCQVDALVLNCAGSLNPGNREVAVLGHRVRHYRHLAGPKAVEGEAAVRRDVRSGNAEACKNAASGRARHQLDLRQLCRDSGVVIALDYGDARGGQPFVSLDLDSAHVAVSDFKGRGITVQVRLVKHDHNGGRVLARADAFDLEFAFRVGMDL